jgi:N6-adenosine-specific RNA methylase IME4
MIITDISIDRKYGIIYSDPPWEREKGGIRYVRKNQKRDLDYKTMSMYDIQEFHANVFNAKTKEKHNVFMWTIDKYLHETEKMMEEIGYYLHARIIWDKFNGVAPAFTVRFAHEYLLWFYERGNMLMPCKGMRGFFTDVIREAGTKHSVKPEFAYSMIENMFPNEKYLELFARKERKGWDCFGDELNLSDNYIEIEID